MALKLESAGWRRKIPQSPGVYFFKDNRGKTLYIGKAANLRARLRSRILPKETKSISWEILNSEVEALIREAELIKKHLPKYNVLMRDDKQYFYVGFSKNKFPKIFITHQKNREADYIGPFTEGGALRSVLKTLRRAFPYCTCKKPHKRLCLNARIGRCLGFCCTAAPSSTLGVKSPKTPSVFPGAANYQKNITSIKKILSGKNKSLAETLKREMRKLSDARKYEEAGKIRDQIRALEKIFEHRGVIKQDLPAEFAKALRALESILNISDINRIEAYDIANIQGKFAYGSMAVFQNGQIKKNAYRLFKIKSVRGSNDPAMLREVIFRRLKHKEWPYPDIIIVDGGKVQLGAAEAALNPSKSPLRKGRKIKIIALTKNKKHVGDHIFIAGKSSPIPLARLPEPLKNLILMLDSEAHRFAIYHYRKLHRKEMLIQ
ncbi:MAG: UvrB/UvrC motif-containing protein [Candidatus Giovannonibacteria bacterium]|nr:UvrB/UvrC motif-containing protein [Candidatus Giovannonibacteria bacterium]